VLRMAGRVVMIELAARKDAARLGHPCG
jgi:hypothetical protein